MKKTILRIVYALLFVFALRVAGGIFVHLGVMQVVVGVCFVLGLVGLFYLPNAFRS
jgi:hypothetical protein